MEWTERELRALNIHGSHYLPFVSSFKLDWHHAQSKASRYEPDRRNYRYAMENGQYIFYGFKEQEGTNYQRRFSLLEENTADFGAQLTKLFRLWGPSKKELTLGFNQVDKARKSRVRRYGLNKGAGDLIGFSGKGDPLEEIFDKCVNCFVFKDDAGPSDNYSASQSIESYYLTSKL